MSIAKGVAVLLGEILADIKFLYAYVFGTGIQAAALIVAFRFTEPTAIKQKPKDNPLAHQVITSVKVLKARKIVLYLILFSALVGSLPTTVFFYSFLPINFNYWRAFIYNI